MTGPIHIARGGDLARALAAAKEKCALGDGQNRRLGAEMALAAVYDHLRNSQGIAADLLKPVHELIDSLNALDFGQDDPMFAPSRKGGRQPTSPRREQLRQVVAVAVSVLMDGGEPEAAANDHIAHWLGEIGVKGYLGKKISGPTVGNWRSLVMADLPLRVGLPGKPDDTAALDIALNEERERRANVLLYLVWWRKWRGLGKPHHANVFVERILVPDMRAFLDPK